MGRKNQKSEKSSKKLLEKNDKVIIDNEVNGDKAFVQKKRWVVISTNILLLILACSFVVWGVGDIFNKGKKNYIAKVGKESIEVNDFNNVLQKEKERFAKATGRAISDQDLPSLKNFVLQRMVTMSILDQELKSLHIIINNDIVKSEIASNPEFATSDKFDKEKFKALLQANNITEGDYINYIKQQLKIEVFLNAVTINYPHLQDIIRALYISRNQAREMDIINIKPSYIKNTREPNNDELLEFYNKNKQLFMTHESRDIRYIDISLHVMNSSSITESDKLKYYNEHYINKNDAETRSFYNLIFKTEAEAKKALDILYNKKKNILQIARELGKNEKDVLIENATAAALLPEIKDNVFSLKEGELYKKVIKSPFGFHIVELISIHKAPIVPFAKVQNIITNSLKREKVCAEGAATLNKVQDEISAGSDLKELAKKLNLSIQTVSLQKDLPYKKAILESTPGANSLFIGNVFKEVNNAKSKVVIVDEKECVFSVAQIDNVNLARQLSLDEVRGSAVKHWKDIEKEKQLEIVSKKISNELRTKYLSNKGFNLNAFVRSKNLTLVRKNFTRVAVPSPTIKTINDAIFSLNNNGVTDPVQQQDGSYTIAILHKIIPAKTEHKDVDVTYLAQDLKKQIQTDVMEKFYQYLEKKYKVEINKDLL